MSLELITLHQLKIRWFFFESEFNNIWSVRMSFNKEEELKIQKIRDWILTQEHLPQEFGENFFFFFKLFSLWFNLI